jgi:4-hydroxybenzoate polyprenyltransferase
VKRYLRLARPFTLFPPLLGIVSGAVCAFGSAHNPDPSRRVTWAVVLTVAIGSLCASAMNAASNIVNQIADLEIDRENKPGRPLVTGEISIRRAAAVATMLYVLTIVPTWLVVPYPYTSFAERLSAPARFHAAFFIYCVGALASLAYSFPALGRTKRHWLAANLTIAVTRGGLLKVAGWAFIASVFVWEAWTIGGIFRCFCWANRPRTSPTWRDRAHGCVTLPIRLWRRPGCAHHRALLRPSVALIPLFPGTDPARSSATLLTGNQTFRLSSASGCCPGATPPASSVTPRTSRRRKPPGPMYLLMMTSRSASPSPTSSDALRCATVLPGGRLRWSSARVDGSQRRAKAKGTASEAPSG